MKERADTQRAADRKYEDKRSGLKRFGGRCSDEEKATLKREAEKRKLTEADLLLKATQFYTENNPVRVKYGVMPPSPLYQAKVRGDAELYTVWAVDWLNHRVLINRSDYEWVSIANLGLKIPPTE